MNTFLVIALAVTGTPAIFFLLMIVVALVEFYAGLLLLDDRLEGRLGGPKPKVRRRTRPPRKPPNGLHLTLALATTLGSLFRWAVRGNHHETT